MILNILLLCWLLYGVTPSVGSVGYEGHSGMFDPQGRLPALDFATRAIDKNGGPVCAFTTSDGICVISATPRSSSKSSALILQEEVQKVQLVDKHVLVALSGYSTELHLPSLVKLNQNYRVQYGKSIPIEMLCEEVAEFFNLRCRKAGNIPLRCKLLVCGHDEDLGYQIYSIQPDGSYDAWKAIAIGKESSLISQSLVKLQEAGQQSLATLWPTVKQTLLDKFFFKSTDQHSDEDNDTQQDATNKEADKSRMVSSDEYEVEVSTPLLLLLGGKILVINFVFLLAVQVFVLSTKLDDDESNEEDTWGKDNSVSSMLNRIPRWRKMPLTQLLKNT